MCTEKPAPINIFLELVLNFAETPFSIETYEIGSRACIIALPRFTRHGSLKYKMFPRIVLSRVCLSAVKGTSWYHSLSVMTVAMPSIGAFSMFEFSFYSPLKGYTICLVSHYFSLTFFEFSSVIISIFSDFMFAMDDTVNHSAL